MKDTLEYTAEQVTEFHSLLQAKMVKAQKKKSLKAKKEEKGTIEAAKRAAAAEAAAAQKAEEERQRKEQAELQVKIKAQHAAHQERIKRHREAQAKIDEHNALVNAYLDRLSVQQKKLKALRKKQRDVIELQEKVDACKKADKSFKVSKEQQQKLDRLDAIEEEIEEVSEVEKEVFATCPGELLPNAVLEADPEPFIVLTPTVPKTVPPQLQIPLVRANSSESILESATTMEVSVHRAGAASTTHNTIAITQVPLNEKSAHNLHAASHDSSRSGPQSPSDSESQFTTPFSFSPVHARSSEVEPRRSFWGAATSSTATATTSATTSSSATKPGPLSTAMDADNWRVKKPVVASLSSAPAATSSTSASNTTSWRSPTATQAAVSSGASSVGGWNKVPLAAPTQTVPVVAPKPVAKAAVAPDAWVTAATKKKGTK